jgi:hypothetical protein
LSLPCLEAGAIDLGAFESASTPIANGLTVLLVGVHLGTMIRRSAIRLRDSRIRRYVDLLEARTDSTDRHVYARIRVFVPELREPKVAEAGRGGDVLV